MSENKTKLKIQTKPTQAIQLNRPLIITGFIVVTTVLLFSIITAFNTPTTKKKQDATGTTKTASSNSVIINPELKDLPSDYSDVNAIRKYSSEPDNTELMLLIKKLSYLEKEHMIMKQKLASMKQQDQPSEPPKPIDPPRTKEAKSSSLVFNGLGSGIENMFGPGGRNAAKQKENEQLVASDEQADFFRKQAENEEKIAVMKAKDNPREKYDMRNMTTPASKYQVMAGTFIPATLVTGINTSMPGSVTAQVRQNIYDTVTGKYLLIPKGSRVLGEQNSRVSAGQQRVLITFKRIIRPDGSSLLLSDPIGSDLMGLAGIEGDVDEHWGRVLGASAISTILSVGAGVASDGFGNNTDKGTARQNGFLGAARGITNMGNMLAGRAMSIPPTITLPPGHNFNVSVKRDMILNPYKGP